MFAVEEEALSRVIEEEGEQLARSGGVWGGFGDAGVGWVRNRAATRRRIGVGDVENKARGRGIGANPL